MFLSQLGKTWKRASVVQGQEWGSAGPVSSSSGEGPCPATFIPLLEGALKDFHLGAPSLALKFPCAGAILASGGWVAVDPAQQWLTISAQAPRRQVGAEKGSPFVGRWKPTPRHPDWATSLPTMVIWWRVSSLMKPVAQRTLYRAHSGKFRAKTPLTWEPGNKKVLEAGKALSVACLSSWERKLCYFIHIMMDLALSSCRGI